MVFTGVTSLADLGINARKTQDHGQWRTMTIEYAQWTKEPWSVKLQMDHKTRPQKRTMTYKGVRWTTIRWRSAKKVWKFPIQIYLLWYIFVTVWRKIFYFKSSKRVKCWICACDTNRKSLQTSWLLELFQCTDSIHESKECFLYCFDYTKIL